MNYDERIAELEEEIAKVRRQKEEWYALPERFRLATLLHNKQCNWNHEDGCGWFYESWDNYQSRYSRSHYVEKADKMLREVDYETAAKMVSIL